MKISLKKYAQALVETLEHEKEQKVVKQKMENLLKLLVKKKQSKLIKGLEQVFKELWLNLHGKMEVNLTVAHEPSEKEIFNLTNLLKEVFKKEIILKIKMDNKVIGGVKLEFADYVVDATILNSLQTLQYHLAQS